MTSQDVAPQSFLAFVVSGGLNLQIEHHLFPAVNHWHLRRLQPRVAALCKQHGVNYPVSASFADAVAKIWAHMRELADPLASARAGVVELETDVLFGRQLRSTAGVDGDKE